MWDIYIERILPIELINPSITSHIYFIFFLVRILKFYSISKFQFYNTMLSIIVATFYIIS